MMRRHFFTTDQKKKKGALHKLLDLSPYPRSTWGYPNPNQIICTACIVKEKISYRSFVFLCYAPPGGGRVDTIFFVPLMSSRDRQESDHHRYLLL